MMYKSWNALCQRGLSLFIGIEGMDFFPIVVTKWWLEEDFDDISMPFGCTPWFHSSLCRRKQFQWSENGEIRWALNFRINLRGLGKVVKVTHVGRRCTISAALKVGFLGTYIGPQKSALILYLFHTWKRSIRSVVRSRWSVHSNRHGQFCQLQMTIYNFFNP